MHFEIYGYHQLRCIKYIKIELDVVEGIQEKGRVLCHTTDF